MNTMLYFAYGSNMSTPRLRNRVPSARAVAVARLKQHRLKFHKQGKDSSGKCDAECTNYAQDVVYGVVFEIAASQKPKLDEKEGLQNGYEEKNVLVYIGYGEELKAVIYYATHIEPTLKPYEWYKEHVLRGAREHGLPADYVTTIETVTATPDPDKSRHDSELSIYY